MDYDVEITDDNLVAMINDDRFTSDPEPRQPDAVDIQIGRSLAEQIEADKRGEGQRLRRLPWHSDTCDCAFCVKDRDRI